MKKRLAVMCMAAALATTMMPMGVLAAENTKTLVTDSEKKETEREYKAYQIFTGDYYLNESGEKILSNVDFSDNVSEQARREVKQLLGLPEDASVDEVLKVISGENFDAKKFAASVSEMALRNGEQTLFGNGQVLAVVDGKANIGTPGYFIIIDTTEELGEGESRNAALLQTTNGTLEIKDKKGTVTSDKKVADCNDSTGEKTNGACVNTADHDIGDVIDFKLTGTVAENYDLYENYVFIFHDRQSEGLALLEDSFIVTVENAGEETITLLPGQYTVATAATEGYDAAMQDGCTFEVRFENMKNIPAIKANSTVVVDYQAVLTKDAVIGAAGNPNEMTLEFSNNPDTQDTGKTKVHKTTVFTYKVVVNKVDDNKNPLAGAQFALFKLYKDWTPEEGLVENKDYYVKDQAYYQFVAEPEAETGDASNVKNRFTFKGLDDGQYILVETKTPDGYNTIAPYEFTVKASHDDGELKLTSLNGDLIVGEVELTTNVEDGCLTTDIQNKKGTLLPSTGGMGTTLFYLIGSALVVGAGITLFVRRRITKEL